MKMKESVHIKSIEEINDIADKVVDCIFAVHRAVGPGFRESAYEACLKEEFDRRGIKYEAQVQLPLIYKGKTLEKFYKLDLIVEDEIIIELKCASEILPIFKAQLLSYLKMSGRRIGYVANFNTELMKNGIKRMRLDSNTGFVNVYKRDEDE